MKRLLSIVLLGAVAGCTAAPEPASTARRSGSAATHGSAAAEPAPSTTAASSAAAAPSGTASASAVVAAPPVFPAPMVKIERGAFMMGCPKTAAGVCRDDEKPRHRVQLRPYEIDRYEVTVGHYKACMDAGACSFPMKEIEALSGSRARKAAICREQFRPALSKRPMVCVGMTEAQQYCEWRGKRLPTEAEWERAARGDSGTKDQGARLYPWGDELPDAKRACVQTEGRCEVGSHPGGVSPYGLFDMVGNAAEWVWDYYDPTFYASSPVRDPDGSWELLPIHKQSCSSPKCWTVRGGSWRDEPAALRSTARLSKAPDDMWVFATIGFRCARSTEPARRAHFANRVNLWNAKRLERNR